MIKLRVDTGHINIMNSVPLLINILMIFNSGKHEQAKLDLTEEMMITILHNEITEEYVQGPFHIPPHLHGLYCLELQDLLQPPPST